MQAKISFKTTLRVKKNITLITSQISTAFESYFISGLYSKHIIKLL